MTKSKRKKILIYCQQVLAEALNKSLGKNYITLIGETLTDIKTFKPTVIVFDRDVERILKYSTKKTHCFFLSSGEVFSGINEIGFQSKDLPNTTTKNGRLLVLDEEAVKQKENYLIMRLSNLFDKKELDIIVNRIKNNQVLDNRIQLYPMCPYGVVKVIDTLLSLESKGTIHLRGSERTTQYKIGEILAEILKLNKPTSFFKQDDTQVNIKLAGIVLPTVIRTILVNLYKGELNG